MTFQNRISASELNNSAWKLRYADQQKALALAKEAEALALKSEDIENVHLARLTQAQLEFWMMINEGYLTKGLSALNYFKNENFLKGQARAGYICASMYEHYGEYDKALQCALNAIKVAEQTDELDIRAECYTVLGQIYSRIQEYKQAIREIKKGLELRKQLNDTNAIASSLNLLGRNNVLDKKFEDGEKYYEESLALREKINDARGLPWTYLGLASLYAEKGETEKALQYYSKVEAFNLTKEKRLTLLYLLGKGRILIQVSKNKEAIETLLEAESEARKQKKIPFMAEASQLLSSLYEAMGDEHKALLYFKRFHELNHILLGQEKTNSLKNQQVAFSIEQAEKETEIYRLRNVELKEAFDKIDIQHKELEEKNKEIIDSINYAKNIQDAYLPDKGLFNQILPEGFLLYKPKDIVSGDFFWFSKLMDGSVLFATADCTGHGVPGAIMSVICTHALDEVITKQKIYEPDQILNEVRRIVIDVFKKEEEQGISNKDGMDIALCRIDYKKSTSCFPHF